MRSRIKAIAYVVSLIVFATAAWGPAPIMAQAFPGGGPTGGSGSGSTGPCALNAAQTPDSYLCGTDTAGNSFIFSEAADSSFDFAHAQATDPTLFIHSHNQNTTQWISLVHNGTRGIINDGTGVGVFISSGNATGTNGMAIGANLARMASGVQLGWSSTTDPGVAADTVFTREAAATFQTGLDVNGAAVNQTLKAHDGITGTDILGASLILESGRGTGAAVSNPLTINRQITKATGTTAQTYAPAEIHCPSKILSSTSATTTTVATITTTTTSGGNVTMDYGTTACSGTTCDDDGGIVKVGWNNNAGTVVSTMTAVVGQSDSDATGNITTGGTVTVATNVVSIKVTPVFTTIVPTSVVFTASFTVHSAADTVVCQ